MAATDEEGPRQNGEIIDAHVHLLPERRTRSLVRWVKKFYPAHPTSEDITIDEVLDDLSGCGVGKFFNLVFPLKEEETEPLNLFSREIAERYGNVVGFGSMHIETPRKDEVAERCTADYGLAGIKLHPYAQRFEVFSPEFDPLYRKLDELRKPFVVHTGFDLFYNRTQDFEYLRGILERNPNMPVVFAHALFPRFKLAYELLSEYPQVYLDMTNSITCMRWYEDSPEFWRDKLGGEEIERNLEHFHLLFERFSSRIMFGTDHPVGMGRPAQLYEDLDWFDFDQEIKENLLGRTALAFHDAHCRSG
jgi:predicted TIM-barrel fold metal-dependent hydrolase